MVAPRGRPAAPEPSDARRGTEAERSRDTATQGPFSDVFAALLALFAPPNAGEFTSPAVLAFAAAHPEMHRWIPDADAQRLVEGQPTLDTLASAMLVSTHDTETDG